MLALLSLLGAGGIGAALFFIPGLRLAISGIIDAIPPKVWLAIGAALLLGGGAWLVSHKIAAARAEGYARGGADREAKWQGAFDEMHRKAAIYKAGFEQVSREQAAALRSKTDETIRRNAVAADDLRLRGPGAAAAPVCRPGSSAPDRRAADRPDHSGRPADAPLAPLPADEPLAIVPWADLVSFAQQHDRYRTERGAVIEHIDTQNRLLDDLRAKLQAAVPEFGGEPAP